MKIIIHISQNSNVCVFQINKYLLKALEYNISYIQYDILLFLYRMVTCLLVVVLLLYYVCGFVCAGTEEVLHAEGRAWDELHY